MNNHFITVLCLFLIIFNGYAKEANTTKEYNDGYTFGKENIPDIKNGLKFGVNDFADEKTVEESQNSELKNYYNDDQGFKAKGFNSINSGINKEIADVTEQAYTNKPTLDLSDPTVIQSIQLKESLKENQDGSFNFNAVNNKAQYVTKTCLSDTPEKRYCQLVPEFDYTDISEYIHIEKKFNAQNFAATDFNPDDTDYVTENPLINSMGVQGNDTVIVSFKVPPKSTVYSYHFKHTFDGYAYQGGCSHPPTEGISFDINGYFTDYGHKPLKYYSHNIIDEIKAFDEPFYVKDDNLVVRVNRNDWWHAKYGHPIDRKDFLTELKNGRRTFELEVDIVAPKPRVKWVRKCDFNLTEQGSIPRNFKAISNKCVVKKPETAEQLIAPISLDCYQYEEVYEENTPENQDNQCKVLAENKLCEQESRVCNIYDQHGQCTQYKSNYACQISNLSNRLMDIDLSYKKCEQDDCGLNENGDQMNNVVSQLSTLVQSAKDIADGDINDIKIFSGKGLQCRKAILGYKSCCLSEGGWGTSIGLAHCSDEEKELSSANDKGLTIPLGEYCAHKVLGVCTEKKRSYCAFGSKIAKIVQEQGSVGQLGLSLGSAENPKCDGLSLESFEKIKFEDINYSEFYDELESNMNIPNEDKLKQKVTDKYKGMAK